MEKKLTSTKALILLIITTVIVLGGVMVVKAPNTIVLIAAGTTAITLALIWGIKWDDIQNDIVESIKTMFPSILILLCVGMLVGAWILSGTIPVMVYYGLKILRPSTFLVASVLICSLMSVMAGTSWGTMSTVGVALMGVSLGLGIPAHYTAGAVLAGAIFGDKLSPLSDTTVLAAAVSEVGLVDHIKHMLYTTIPGLLISIILYFIIGLQYRGGTVGGENLQLILSTLETSFNLNPILLLPPVLVLYLIFKNKPTIPVFGIGIIFGCLLAAIFQGSGLQEIGTTLNGGYAASTGVEIVDEMLMRGGLNSMLGTVALLIAGAVFGSPLKTAGVIQLLLDKIQSVAKTGRTILVSTYFLHIFLFMITGAYYVTFSVVGPMLKSLYDQYGINRNNLSRALEDSGTAFAPLVPWSTFSAFTVATLGVPVSQYAPFAPLTYLSIVFGLLYAVTGFKTGVKDNPKKVKKA